MHIAPQATRARTLKLALLPVAGITLLLTLLLTALYINQLGTFAEERGYHISRLLSQLTYQSMHNRVLLQSVVNTSVTEGDILAVRVYDLNHNPLIHAGPRFSKHFSIDPGNFGLEASHQRQGNSTLFTVPIHADHDAFAPFGWLLVEIKADDYTLLEYKTLLLALLLGTLFAVASAAFSMHFGRQLSDALQQLRNGLYQLRKGHLDTRLDQNAFTECDELVSAFNQLASGLKQQQDDIQRNMDQSIEDLRETLETIEIQNIELDLARKEAVEASRVKSDFLANTSHEIRTPLNGIIGFTSLLLKTTLTDQQKEYLRTIQHSSQGLLTIINDVLDFSKIESGRLQLDYVPMQLRPVIEEAMQIMAPAAHEKAIQLVLLVDQTLPTNLLGDPLRLKQVLTNLISNAIKFSNGGNVEIEVQLLSLEESQVELSVSVKDSGNGVPEADRQKLFRAFSQLDTSNSRQHGGTGLGLAVSKGLIKRMNGNIGVQNSESGGALFWFSARFGIDQMAGVPEPTHLLANQLYGLISNNAPLKRQLKQIIGQESGKLQLAEQVSDLLALVKRFHQENQPLDTVLYDIEPHQERNLDTSALSNLRTQLWEHYRCKMLFLCTPSARRALEQYLGQQDEHLMYLEKPVVQLRLLQLLNHSLSREDSEQSPSNTTIYESRPRILAVDDNPANLQLVGELLSGLGMDVALASDGKQAIDLAEQKQFDMVFMDLQMPIMDGIEATKIIRSREIGKRRTPIVALTAHAMAEQKSQLLLAGMDDYLSKPVSEAQLAHVINRWLKTRNQHNRWQPKAPLPLPSQEEATPDSPMRVLDLTKSLQLANNKPGLAKDMLSMLLANLRQDQTKIRISHQNLDYKTLEATVHRLHGGCCYCGAERLRMAAYSLDKSLQSKQYQMIEKQLEKLDQEINALLAWSEEHDLDVLFETNAV